MKRQGSVSLIFAAISIIIVAQSSCARRPVTEFPSPTEGDAVGRDETDIANARWEWFRRQRTYPFDSFPAGARRKAWEAMTSMRGLMPLGTSLGWNPIGPGPSGSPFQMGSTSGRINAIAISPADPNVVLVGSSAGGIWRSGDGGNSFVPVSDSQADLEVGSIAFAPSDPNIVYAGMGDLAGGLLGYGVLKSLDGGQTWTRVDNGSLGEPGLVSGIGVDPTNPNLVYLAQYALLNGSSLFASGFCRSSDGGVSWTRPLSGLPTDMAVDRATPGTIYLALSRVDRPTGQPAGIYQSVDGGNNWKAILPFTFTRSTGTAKVAVAPSNPQMLYAYYGGFNTTGPEQIILQASTDSGATWSPRSLSGVDAAQFGYNTYIAVDPADPATLYVGSRDVYKSTDSGMTWKNLTLNYAPTGPSGSLVFQPDKATAHADQHVMAFSPSGSSHVLIGNDGGLWRSNDAGNTFQSLNSTLSLVQFYSTATHPLDSGLTFGGTQDNGSQKQQASAAKWNLILTGDGGYCFVDPTDPSILFVTYINGNVYRLTADGDKFDKTIGTNKIFGEPDTGPRISFIAPFTSDGVHDVLYFGSWRLFTSIDRGNNWTAPGGMQDLTNGVSPTTGTDVLSAIGVGPANPNVIYTGSSQGRTMVSKDGGATWTDITQGLPNRHITGITVSASDSNTAYVTFSGYATSHVFQTSNAGASWNDVTGNLPDIPVDSLLVDPTNPNILYAGTDIGVFASTSGGYHWAPFSTGLPAVIVRAFAVRPNGNIVAATYGRGAYDLAAGIKPPSVDFSLSPSPGSLTASRGDAITVTLNVGRTGGLSDPVTVTPPDTSGVGIKIKPGGPVTGDSVRFTLKIKGKAPVGPQQLGFKAQDPTGLTRLGVFSLTIQ
jgi:photosystem II stability/assembly factor-like uncharacterized protein